MQVVSVGVGVKLAKIGHGLYFDYDTKLVAMETSLEILEKLDQIDNIHTYGEKKIMKIGPVDPEIALLNLKKKLRKVKYTARSAGLLS